MADLVTDASGATISTMIGNYYDHVFFDRLEANLVFDKWGDQRPLPENMGNTVVWHQMLNPGTGYDLPDGATPGASAMSARKISATLSYKADLRAISDQVDRTAVCPVVEETVAALGYGAALTKDRFISDKIGFASAISTGVANAASAFTPSIFSQGFPVMDGNANVVYWPTSGKAVGFGTAVFSTTPKLIHVANAVTFLKGMNAVTFEDGNYRGIVHPVIAGLLRQDTSWPTWNAYANRGKAFEKGQLGAIERVMFEESSEALNKSHTASAWAVGYLSLGGTLYGTLIFGKQAYGVTKLGGKDAKVNVISGADKSDPLNQRTYVGYKLAMAAQVTNPSAGVILATYITN